MSEYAKNIQTIEDMWKKRIELREGNGGRMSEYIITDKQMGLIQDFATVCVEGEKLPRIVRCGDCKHYDPDDEPSEVFPNSYWCDRLTVYMPPNGFCSWGERREP